MFEIAVPSYNRVATFRDKTYLFLQRHELLENTTVFVVPEEEGIYKNAFPDLRVVVGVKGLGHQRKFIYDYYPEGTQICQLDDDVQTIIDETRKELNSLRYLITYGFELLEKEDCRLWGIYPVSNPFFFKPDYSTELKFIFGVFFGILKKGETHPVCLQDKEDVYRSCWYYKQDQKVVRLNSYAPITKYCTNKGGIQRTSESVEDSVREICQEFPDYTTPYIRKRNMHPEIRLKDKSKK
jgi:hypothetical protein